MTSSVLPRPPTPQRPPTPWVATAMGLLVGVVLTGWAVTHRPTEVVSAVPSTQAASGLPAEGETLTIEIVGRGFEWYVRHPGPDLQLGTSDDVEAVRDVRVPAGMRARLALKSDDYLYSLALPHLGRREIAVPDMEFSLDVDAQPPGTFELRGDQMCGFAHPRLIGRLIVQSPAEYAAWVREHGSASE